MSADEIVEELRALGRPEAKKVLARHGVPEPFFGTRIEDMKPIQKRIKKDYRLALELYSTGIFDAMYLAGLIADDARMTKKDLRSWATRAHCAMISEYTVPWVAAGGPRGWDMAAEWIESGRESVASSGWAAYSSLVSVVPDADIDCDLLRGLLRRAAETIHAQPNRVRYVMNGFVIAVGCYVAGLTDLAMETAAKIGKVEVDMHGTSCKVPAADDYIRKVRQRGTVGKKRKSAKC